jgi:AAA+ ATPase superfamily predicted ATPase
VEGCPAGLKPDKASYDEKAKNYTVKMSKETCTGCPLQGQCPIKTQKKKNVVRFSEKRYHKGNNIMVIVCGALSSMMLNQVLSHQSPLYGRRTAQIRLAPLAFTELLAHNKGKTFDQMVETYAVTGGVPKCYDFFNNEAPLMENIEQKILQKDGFLYEEPVFLLEKEVWEPISYFSFMRSIAVGNHKLSQIAGNLEIPSNKLSPYMRTLMDLNLVEKRVPITESQPQKTLTISVITSSHSGSNSSIIIRVN